MRGKYSPIIISVKQTLNKSDNHHNNAINENLNWGGFPGCYRSLPPTEDRVPRSRTIQGGGGREAGDNDVDNTNKGLDSMSNDELLTRNFPQRNDNVEGRSHQEIERKE